MQIRFADNIWTIIMLKFILNISSLVKQIKYIYILNSKINYYLIKISDAKFIDH